MIASLLSLHGCTKAEEVEEQSQNQVVPQGKPNTEKKLEENPSSNSPTNRLPEGLSVSFHQGEITATIASWEEAQHFIASQKGKIVVLDLWSTSCVPCIREYPHLVALQKKYPEQVVCVSFNVDYYGGEENPPELNRDAVMKVLVKHHSKLKNFISSTPDEALYKKIDLASIPVAFVYNKEGTLEKRFDNETKAYSKEGFSYEKNIVPLVEKLLSKMEQKDANLKEQDTVSMLKNGHLHNAIL